MWISQVEEAVAAARQHVNDGSAAWAAVWVWGQPNAPTTWHGQPKATYGVGTGGEDDYIILIPSHDNYCIFAACGAGIPDPFSIS